MEAYDIFEHDVLVIGAGGAGLRATIAAAEAGLNVGVVCKSLLGKAHTVMAEGGIAGSLANLDKKDSWQVHFMDTMRGGQFLNNWRTVEIRAKVVILATGGWGRMYKVTSNSWESTGDGAVLAYHARAELLGMEMVPFHPTGMVWPPGVRGLLVTEGVRGDGGVLRNGPGERFMFDPKYTPATYKGRYSETEEEATRWLDDKANNRPPPELLPRDVVARAIYREVLAGNGSEHGGVYLDVTHRGADFIRRKLPSMYEQFHALGDVDITTQPMEVYPTIHYTMGGVRAEPETAATTVPGLYAAGESAAGVHGANRLGGNALCDILVFGRRAGEAAAQYARATPLGALDEAAIQDEAASLLAPFASPGTENPYLLTQELQAVMQEGAMIARTEEGLQKCLAGVLALQERARNLHVDGTRLYNPGWHTARDIRNMLTVSEIIVRCALERRESRGAQWRTDYPDPDPVWGKKNLVATEGPDGVQIMTIPVPEMPPELAQLFEAK